MNTFFRGLGGVCLGTLAGAGLGAATFFTAEAVLPKQADAAPEHTYAKTLSLELCQFKHYLHVIKVCISEIKHVLKQQLSILCN